MPPSYPPNIVYCDGGLCNRLNEVIFAIILRSKFGGTWEIAWPKTNWCRASFGQLFTLNMHVTDRLMDYFEKHKESYQFIVHENFGNFDTNRVTFHSQLDSYEAYGRIIATQKPIYYTHSLIPLFATVGDLSIALQHLRINPLIYAKAASFCNQHQIDQQVIGLHIRKTDFGSRVNDDTLYHLVQSNTNRFFVCSDDQETNYRFSLLPNCIVFPKTSFPEKLSPSLDWNIAFLDNQGEIADYNINRPETSIIEALIDLLILSNTNLVETSSSTFLRMAMIFRATNFFHNQSLLQTRAI